MKDKIFVQDTMYYVHQDRLGSYAVITDDTGQVRQRLGYDVWGNRVLDTNWTIRAEFDNGDFDYIFRRGFTGHEHLGSFGIINMNGRIYDPNIASFFSPDPYVVDATSTQAFNRYSYCLNNPLMYTDPSGEFVLTALAAIFCPPLLPVAIGADIGLWSGGTMANGTANPFKWDYSSGKTWGYMLGGAAAGGFSAGIGSYIASASIPFANTLGIAISSYTNSFMMNAITGGSVPLSISLGVASYDITNNEWGYLGKKGNNWLQNLGYGFGALANVRDVWRLIDATTAHLYTQDVYDDSKDWISHSGILDKDGGNIMSYGPGPEASYPKGGGMLEFALRPVEGTSNYPVSIDLSIKSEPFTVNKYLFSGLRTVSEYIPYQGISSNCVNWSSLGLWLNGIPNIGLHPYLLHGSMWLYNTGIYNNLSYQLILKRR